MATASPLAGPGRAIQASVWASQVPTSVYAGSVGKGLKQFESKTTRAVCGCLRQGEKRLILIDKEFEIRILFSVPFSTFSAHQASLLGITLPRRGP